MNVQEFHVFREKKTDGTEASTTVPISYEHFFFSYAPLDSLALERLKQFGLEPGMVLHLSFAI